MPPIPGTDRILVPSEEVRLGAVRAVVVDPDAPSRFTIREVEARVSLLNEGLVKVAAISLNAGETRRALAAAAGWQPDGDLAGTMIEPVANGNGPAAGTRVVGIRPAGAWAEVVPVPADCRFDGAPGAGKGRALGGPTGADHGRLRRRWMLCLPPGVAARGGGDWDGAALRPFDLSIESVGAATRTAALKLLTPHGVCVRLGAMAGSEIAFAMREVFSLGSVALLGFHGVRDRGAGSPPGRDLVRLARRIAEGHRRARVEVEATWTEIAEQAQALLERRPTGTAVLWVDG